MFIENDTNPAIFGGSAAQNGFFKDRFHRYPVDKDRSAVNPAQKGTRAAVLVNLQLKGSATRVLRLRLAPDEGSDRSMRTVEEFDSCLARRMREADAFFASRIPATLNVRRLI